MAQETDDERRMVIWRGPENCEEVFLFLGMEHPDDETDHTEIHYEAEGETVTATPGDVIGRDEQGSLMPPFKSGNWLMGGARG